MKKKRAITIRMGPLVLSLLAAGITAVGLAAVSLADSSGDNSGSNDKGPVTIQAPGGAAEKVFSIQGQNLSAADRQKMEEFQQCMQDNGAPAPPDPRKFDPSQGPPNPPSEADQKKMEQAWEACKDKLPEAMQQAGPPRIATCGQADGAPGENGQQQNKQGAVAGQWPHQ